MAIYKRVILFILSIIITTSLSKGVNPSSVYSTETKQDKRIKSIIKNEKSIKHLKSIYEIINRIDYTYSNLYKKLDDGRKLVIFFDPAHGKLKSGQWQGNRTWRQSTTGKPEEYYSIEMSRKIYNMLKENPYIEVQSTEDYMEVLKGNSEVYKNIPFSRTIELSKRHNAFMIISEHLNNVNPVYKADGLHNLPGFHITCNKFSTWTLSYVKSAHRGFLTLYNKVDASAFSMKLAESTKQNILARGLKCNNWEQGAVGDDRFSYFVDYPISVIYENGFISHPEEEKLLLDEDYQSTIVEAQYKSLLKTLDEVFGVNISDGDLEKTNDNDKRSITQLKLGRICTYYIKNSELNKAQEVITLIEKTNDNDKNNKIAKYYKNLKEKLELINENIERAEKLKKKRKYKKACKYYKKALSHTNKKNLFYPVRKKIVKSYNKIARRARKRKLRKRSVYGSTYGTMPEYVDFSPKSERHRITKPFILTIEEGQTIDEAVKQAISPKKKYARRVLKTFRGSYITKRKWVRRYSRKRKKWYWKKRVWRKKVKFKPGLYIVKLNRKYKLTKVQRASFVTFSPKKYQNQYYFKNSCLAEKRKIKRT